MVRLDDQTTKPGLSSVAQIHKPMTKSCRKWGYVLWGLFPWHRSTTRGLFALHLTS